mgnify:CR=1 FL=1|jgi:hypothetical protein
MSSSWYRQVTQNLDLLPDFLAFYEKEIEESTDETVARGILTQQCAMIPGTSEYRMGQLKDIEAVLQFLELKVKQLRSECYVKFSEHYNKELANPAILKYIDGDADVVAHELLCIEVARVSGLYQARLTGLERKHYQVGNVAKLQTAGMQDVYIDIE